MSFHFKLMSPEITAPLFVSPRNIPLTVHLAAIWKILSGRKDLQKSPKRSLLQLLFPSGTWRHSTTGNRGHKYFERCNDLIANVVVILEQRDDDVRIEQMFTIHLHLSFHIRL